MRLRLGLSWAREVRKDAAGQRKGTDKILSGSLGIPMAHGPRGKEGQPVTNWEKKAGVSVRLFQRNRINGACVYVHKKIYFKGFGSHNCLD